MVLLVMKQIVILLISILVLSCSREVKTIENNIFFNQGINEVSPPLKAPSFSLKNLDNETKSLKEYKGKVVLLNFWASWCGPCIEEMPSINNLATVTKDLDIEIVTINLGESASLVSKYYNDNNFIFEALLDSDKSIGNNYAVRSIPSTYIIDRDGNIVGSKLGAHKWDDPEIINILKGL